MDPKPKFDLNAHYDARTSKQLVAELKKSELAAATVAGTELETMFNDRIALLKLKISERTT